jgi:hypothetical protein
LLHKQVVVRVPESGEAGLACELLGPDAIESSREVKDGVVELAWTLREAQTGVVPEPNMPPYADFAPMLVVGETASWEELGQAYAAELVKLPALPQELADKATALDAENGPRAIHDFIARNIRMIGVGQREYRLLPHAPEETLRRGMANELDTNFLYFKMLEAADIPCQFALVCGRNTGPLAEDVASLWAFDRSAVYLEKADCFSTVSGDVQPFGVLSGAIQDAPALVADQSNGMLTATQQPRPEDELVATGFDASLDARGNLTIAVTYRGTGNSEGWIRNLKDLDEQQLKNTLQQFAVSLHPAAALASYETTDLADLRVPPVLTLRCTIAGYATKAGEDLMLFNIPAVDYSAGDVGRPDRTLGLFWGHVCREVASGSIRLPAGYRVYSMPETVALDTPTASYNASIAEAESTLRFQDAYDLKVSDAQPEAYRDYKASKELRASVPRQRIILTR